MRVFPFRLFVALSLFLWLTASVSSVAADNGAKRHRVVKRLASHHKHTPRTVRARKGKAAKASGKAKVVRLVNSGKAESAAVVALPAATQQSDDWAVLPLDRKISAKSAIILDGVSGEVLFARSPDLPRQPASTIKVLTSLLAMEYLDDTDIITPSRRAASMPRSKVYLRPGQAYTADDLINAVLLASANDASVALAEKVGGSERNFATLMTAKARSLGARNTICKTATGLTVSGQQSTARDLAGVFNKAMEGEEFANRVGKAKVQTRFGQLLRNHNKALWQVHGAEGGKTGYTLAARQTYVGKFKREQGEVVVALMGSETMWNDVKNLVEYGFQQQEERAGLVAARKKDVAPPVQSVAEQIAAIRAMYAAEAPVGPVSAPGDYKKVSKL